MYTRDPDDVTSEVVMILTLRTKKKKKKKKKQAARSASVRISGIGFKHSHISISLPQSIVQSNRGRNRTCSNNASGGCVSVGRNTTEGPFACVENFKTVTELILEQIIPDAQIGIDFQGEYLVLEGPGPDETMTALDRLQSDLIDWLDGQKLGYSICTWQ